MKKCYRCFSKIEDNNYKDIFGSNVICLNCYNKLCDKKEIYYCSSCSCLIYDAIIAYDEDDDIICSDCYYNNYNFYDAYYKPFPIFSNNDRKNNLHVGIELEMQFEDREQFLNKFKTLNNSKFYLKRDGSLHWDDGVEIISHPMTINDIIENWKNIFDLFNDTYVTNDCGLHFHLDRKYLTKRQIKNIDYIINNFTESIKKIGGRNVVDHFWSKRTEKNINEWGLDTTRCRYVAVNLTNKNTVELRCFDSTDDWEKFKYIIIAVFALVEYAKYHTFEYFTKTNDDAFQKTFRKYIRRFVNKLF